MRLRRPWTNRDSARWHMAPFWLPTSRQFKCSWQGATSVDLEWVILALGILVAWACVGQVSSFSFSRGFLRTSFWSGSRPWWSWGQIRACFSRGLVCWCRTTSNSLSLSMPHFTPTAFHCYVRRPGFEAGARMYLLPRTWIRRWGYHRHVRLRQRCDE